MSVWEKWKISIQLSLDKEGRSRVLRHIWQEFRQPLLWYIRRYVSDRHESEDLLQEIMLKIYEHLDDYDSRYALSTWIYTITRNHCYNHIGKKKPSLQAIEDESLSNPVTPEETILLSEQIQYVEKFFGTLSDTDREITFFRFYQELPYKDIAVILGLPQGTIKYRVHAIRKALMEYKGGK